MWLASADPRDKPRIDPCYLSSPNDVRVLRDGFRIVREVVRRKPLDAFRGEELSPGPGCTSDADIDAHIRMTATTVQHASCTCRIGRDESAVVDAQLRVRGVERLRVVDASVMPEILSCNINAAVLAIAEWASDVIRGRAPLRAETAGQPASAVIACRPWAASYFKPKRRGKRMSNRKKMLPATGRMLIGGQLVESSGGNWIECINPANEECIGKVPRGTPADVERAVAAAENAQIAWVELSVAQRAEYLFRLADALTARADELLMLEVADTGNSITGMNGDVSACIDRLRYFAGLGYELQGTTIPGSSDKFNITIREPYGVVGRIVAFNHPIAMATHGVASPLMAGNSVVLKPSEQCPLSATLLGEIASEVLPPECSTSSPAMEKSAARSCGIRASSVCHSSGRSAREWPSSAPRPRWP